MVLHSGIERYCMSCTLEQLFKAQKKIMSSPMSPIELFNIKTGLISREKTKEREGMYSIGLDLEPFMWWDEVVSTQISLDRIDLGDFSFEELGGKTFKFLVNPEDGYIDGSVYLESTHNPIDVTLISFGARYKEICDNRLSSADDYIVATILYKFCWEGSDPEDYPEIKRANVILQYCE
jgi:hypothetical protein